MLLEKTAPNQIPQGDNISPFGRQPRWVLRVMRLSEPVLSCPKGKGRVDWNSMGCKREGDQRGAIREAQKRVSGRRIKGMCEPIQTMDDKIV